jgi:hypothetical protein
MNLKQRRFLIKCRTLAGRFKRKVGTWSFPVDEREEYGWSDIIGIVKRELGWRNIFYIDS